MQSAKHMQTLHVVCVDWFSLSAGITERFGEGIIEKVKAEGSVELPDGPNGQPWALTNEVSIETSR